jgi:hypothetical protein
MRRMPPSGVLAVPCAVLAATLPLAACRGATVAAPVTRIVELPALDQEPPPEAHGAATSAACPPDTVAEKGDCVRVVASPEIPAWEPPHGPLDPCATWTSDRALVNCDWENAELPPDAGAATPSRKTRGSR